MFREVNRSDLLSAYQVGEVILDVVEHNSFMIWRTGRGVFVELAVGRSANGEGVYVSEDELEDMIEAVESGGARNGSTDTHSWSRLRRDSGVRREHGCNGVSFTHHTVGIHPETMEEFANAVRSGTTRVVDGAPCCSHRSDL